MPIVTLNLSKSEIRSLEPLLLAVRKTHREWTTQEEYWEMDLCRIAQITKMEDQIKALHNIIEHLHKDEENNVC